jgi:hypothetical protein
MRPAVIIILAWIIVVSFALAWKAARSAEQALVYAACDQGICVLLESDFALVQQYVLALEKRCRGEKI